MRGHSLLQTFAGFSTLDPEYGKGESMAYAAKLKNLKGVSALAGIVSTAPEHLICNRTLFLRFQALPCKISAAFPLRSAGVGGFLQNAGGF